MAQSEVDKIDAVLEQYYQTMGRNDYRNDNGDGLFKKYADDNGFDDADIETELQSDPTDCLLVEFDEDFPLNSDIQNEEQERLIAIHNILSHIAKHGQPPSPPKKTKQPSKLHIDLSISEKQAQQIASDVYKQQLSCLNSNNYPEPDLMYFFAVGYINKIPLLTWLVDAYTIDKTKHYIKNVENNNKVNTLTIEDWQQQNQFMKDLMKMDRKKAIKLRMAMTAYSNRLLPRLQYVSPTKIDDDIKEIVDCVSAVPRFLNRLINNNLSSAGMGPPLCVDISFAVRDVKHDITNISPAQSQEDDDDDDDDEDDDDDIIGLHGNMDYIGDLKKKLDANKRCYASTDVPDTVLDLGVNDEEDFKATDDDAPLLGYARFLSNCYNDFREELRENGQYNKEKFPRHKRFGIFVDRRKRNNKHEKNELTFFQQLSSCDTMPSDHVTEWYMEAVRECVIPGIDDEKQQKITAQENVNGQLITFSFNVEAVDEIKCYIIWNGQTMRFKGDNLSKILSYLFVESKDIKEKEEAIRKQLLQFDEDIPDSKFEEFYEQIQRGYTQSTKK